MVVVGKGLEGFLGNCSVDCSKWLKLSVPRAKWWKVKLERACDSC